MDVELDDIVAHVPEDRLTVYDPAAHMRDLRIERVGYGLSAKSPADRRRRPDDWLTYTADMRRSFYRERKAKRAELIARGRAVLTIEGAGRFPSEDDYADAGYEAEMRDYRVTENKKRQAIPAIYEDDIRDSIRHTIETGAVAPGYIVPGMEYIEE